MICPRCENTPLDERERDGILLDHCASCRGVWLDRGELEKLITRATQELEPAPRAREDRSPSAADYHGGERRHPARKRGLLESLGDIFD